MKISSKTGLIPSPTKKIRRFQEETHSIQMITIATPAPFIMKPYAGLYNPFPSNCSLLCNHPTDVEAKELLQEAKDSVNLDIKNATKSNFELNIGGEQLTPTNIYIPQVESVPEELFRRYTDTDSRPQTPAPTLISGITRLSTSRRCITPDPLPSSQVKEKTRLVLDLRRSHSQDHLSIYGSSPFYQEPPLIRIQQALSRSASLDDEKHVESQKLMAVSNKHSNSRRPNSVKKADKLDNTSSKQNDQTEVQEEEDDDDEDFIKRRGKRRRKKGRDTSRGPPTFQASLDPETQVATIGPDSHNPSARHSLAPEGVSPLEMSYEEIKQIKSPLKKSTSLEINSFLSKEILKQLRRELNETIVDSELDYKKKIALEEALKTVTKGKVVCDELALLQKELKVPPVNVDLWISLPRTFTRSSAIFELPMDSRTFNTMTPIDYVKDNVRITSARKLLYNCIFEKYKIEIEDETEYDRRLHCKNMRSCLDLIMGKPLKDEHFNYYKDLINWEDKDVFVFKICCGIFALCERILAPEFCRQLPSKKEDPCHEIETADFNLLEKKLSARTQCTQSICMREE
ncbi:uncharacterized protein LOC130900879 [Diorhabda carinulata]|uniref:uncharacterized protein LOC130900879 n=1 Tax=Diorhabda carinulata TaxID=1163345 RepID=UPI0025A1FC64|nr:uncharacterized protein LOC130900879 [Diorhabda carinulata]